MRYRDCGVDEGTLRGEAAQLGGALLPGPEFDSG